MVIAGTGAVLFMLGASAMDSESMTIPTLLVLVGILLLYVGGRRQGWITNEK